MFRFNWLIGIVVSFAVIANVIAQSPSPSPSVTATPILDDKLRDDNRPPSPSPSLKSSPSPIVSTPTATPGVNKPSPSPTPSATPSTEELINSLNAADLQAAIPLLKNNFTSPDALNETQLNRATLEGLMVRLGHGLMLLPGKASTPSEPSSPFYGEIIDNHVGYLRLGSLNNANLQAMDKKLGEFAAKKVDAVVIDLRASAANDFGMAAEFAKRFSSKGKTLFTLRKQGKQDRSFNSDRDPAYAGLIAVLADSDTAGGAEAVVAALRFHNQALIIGQPTAKRAVEYSDLPLPSGKILRVAVAEVMAPDGKSLYREGVKPDLPVEMSPVDKRQIFQLSAEKGLSPFIYEAGRPHLNEAALIAGTNPELESIEQRRVRAQEKSMPRDAVLQRALDLVTSLAIYQKR